MQAALEELGRGGYDGFRVDAVATNAGVNKTSIYRRWPNKLALVSAALRARPWVRAEPPDLGNVRDDLIASLDIITESFNAVQFRDSESLLRTSEPVPELQELVTSMRDEFFERQAVIIERGIARGELPADTDARFLLENVCSLLGTRTMRMRERVSRPYIARLVDLCLSGAVHGGANRSEVRH